MDVKDALRFALENPYSAFYRERAVGLYDGSDLAAFPFLTREDIARTPLSLRTFVPPQMVAFIRATSGTTGRGVVAIPMAEEAALMAHRASLGFRGGHQDPGRYFGSYFMPEDDFALMTFTPMGPVVETYLAVACGHRSVMGDFRDPERTVALARALGIDSLMAFAPIARSLAPAFARAGVSERIRLLVMVGERLQEAHRAELRAAYPNARIVSLYASTESQAAIGCTCERRETDEPNELHLLATFLPELIDPDTAEPVGLTPGARGELVITSMTPLPFPLIRFRTGDYVEVRGTGLCACGSSAPRVEVLGRAQFDRVKVPYGGITVAALEEATSVLPMRVVDFSACFDQRTEPSGLSMTIFSDDALPADARTTIAGALSVSADRTYADLINEGLMRPIAIAVAPSAAAASFGKRRRLSIER